MTKTILCRDKCSGGNPCRLSIGHLYKIHVCDTANCACREQVRKN